MGRELQKRKRRSSRPAIKQHSSSMRTKKLLNPLGNNIVAQNWDKGLTTTQNYRRLGLVSRLQAPTGGAEPTHSAKKAQRTKKSADPFAIHGNDDAVITEAKVERDADGKIVRVIHTGKKPKSNPLNDPLNALDSDDDDDDEMGDDNDAAAEQEEWGGFEGEEEANEHNVVKDLEAEASRPREKKPRTQSSRETEWLERLIAKHGVENTNAMARDAKLNPMQQTEPDIAKRLRKYLGETTKG